MMCAVYAYPKLSEWDFAFFRLIGPGLGNLLFPWARAVASAERNSMTMIFPAWPQIKVGTVLRREKDKRFYTGLFKATDEYISGCRKLSLLIRRKKIKEDDYTHDVSYYNSADKDIVVVFKGLGKRGARFAPFIKDHDLIFKKLLEITRSVHTKALDFDFSGSVSVHVRLGDFTTPENEEKLKEDFHNYRIPISWYCSQIEKIRDRISKDIKVYIFSDGRDDELAQIFKLGNTERISFGSSIADMIALSCSNILIASGSAFSQWASFLGRMPVLWHPGRLREKLYYDKPNLEIEIDRDSDLPFDILNV